MSRGSKSDGVYDRTKPGKALPEWSYNRPWASNEERLTQIAIDSALAPPEDLQDGIRPPLAQIELFPPRFGYRTRQIGIDDIVNIGRIYAQPRTNFSGGAAGYEGTSRNAQGGDSW